MIQVEESDSGGESSQYSGLNPTPLKEVKDPSRKIFSFRLCLSVMIIVLCLHLYEFAK